MALGEGTPHPAAGPELWMGKRQSPHASSFLRYGLQDSCLDSTEPARVSKFQAAPGLALLFFLLLFCE